MESCDSFSLISAGGSETQNIYMVVKDVLCCSFFSYSFSMHHKEKVAANANSIVISGSNQKL
jgi:hypothetical protein